MPEHGEDDPALVLSIRHAFDRHGRCEPQRVRTNDERGYERIEQVVIRTNLIAFALPYVDAATLIASPVMASRCLFLRQAVSPYPAARMAGLAAWRRSVTASPSHRPRPTRRRHSAHS